MKGAQGDSVGKGRFGPAGPSECVYESDRVGAFRNQSYEKGLDV